MTVEQKKNLAVFLDVAEDFLHGGYKNPEREYNFTDDDIPTNPIQVEAQETKQPEISTPADSIEAIAQEVSACTLCQLHKGRTHAVPGEGVKRPLVLVIGEGPGADEDATGRPFVGKAGQLLEKMLAAVQLSRQSNCFIVNVVKCRPPNNRDPLPEEVASCSSYLARQLNLLKPCVILSLGRIATQSLLQTSEGIGKLRGIFTEYEGLPLIPTYHPSALLRDESLKRFAWEDLKKLRDKLVTLDKHYELEITRGN